MSGLKIPVPTTFTDNSLPLLLHSAGVGGYSFRYTAKSLPIQQGLGEGDSINTWYSQGSVDLPVTAAAAAATAPLLRLNSGNPYVEFDGVTQGLKLAGTIAADSVKTVVMVMRRPSSGGGATPVFSGSGGVPGINLNRNGTLTISGNTGDAIFQSITATTTTWHTVVVVSNLNSSFLMVDGVKSTAVPANAVGVISTLIFGHEVTSYCKYDLMEAICYPSVVSDANLATIRTAMQTAYSGLVI